MRPVIHSVALLAALFAAVLCLAPRPAAADGLTLELNKVEDTPQGCLATVLIANGLGQALDRFRLDLVLFDGKGVVSDRLLIDLAPLPAERTTIANLPLQAGGCAGISRVLLRDIPACRGRQGRPQDCLTGLTVTTRTKIDFGK
ncbi:MAG: hypothetical protein QF521_22610 [Alphaproteobacteria bacterium]|jgi:hypothetical protein|nr:hypothetical protein [Alphaproteobacteria bacterium]